MSCYYDDQGWLKTTSLRIAKDEVDAQKWRDYVDTLCCLVNYINERHRIRNLCKVHIQTRINEERRRRKEQLVNRRVLEGQRATIEKEINDRLFNDLSYKKCILVLVNDAIQNYVRATMAMTTGFTTVGYVVGAINHFIRSCAFTREKHNDLLNFIGERLEKLFYILRELKKNNCDFIDVRALSKTYEEEALKLYMTDEFLAFQARRNARRAVWRQEGVLACPMLTHEQSFAIDLFFDGTTSPWETRTATACTLCTLMHKLLVL